ncbi:MAG TPA: hypothetical protein VK866_14230 [Acidimicrobiales bacterium]|nr:hypothetical protein [Acidimicrobiales bacterium]
MTSMRRGCGVLAVLVVLAAACSGDSGGGGGDAAGAAAPTTTTAPAVATTAVPTTTTTTEPEPEPEPFPVGAAWESADIDLGADTWIRDVAAAGDTVWAVGRRDNAPLALRSVGGGPFEVVDLGPPPGSGDIVLLGAAGGVDGALILFGLRGSDCFGGLAVEGGFTRGALCRVNRGAVFASSDGGATFTYVEPPEMVLGGRQSVDLRAAVHDGEQFVAVGTVRGPDWHARMWTSPDGVTWAAAGELRDPDGSTSAIDVRHAGDTLLVHYEAHPCARDANFNTPGYVLGSDWPEHARLAAGPGPASLAPVTSADLELVPAPRPVDCAVDDPFLLAREPYPALRIASAGDALVVVDDSNDEAGRVAGETGVAQRVDRSWELEMVATGDAHALIDVVDIDGRPALLERETSGGLKRLLVTVSGDDGWSARESASPVLRDSPLIGGAVWSGDRVVLVAHRGVDGDEQRRREILVRTSAPVDR